MVGQSNTAQRIARRRSLTPEHWFGRPACSVMASKTVLRSGMVVSALFRFCLVAQLGVRVIVIVNGNHASRLRLTGPGAGVMACWRMSEGQEPKDL
jgi:hypothetical protein